MLDEIVSEVPEFQGAFTRCRSVDDHVFVVRRVLEECWRAGERVFVVALDIEKAFDSLDLGAAVTCLKGLGVPHFLVNRIIGACFDESTSILWYGQTTEPVQKAKGVKQGCPLSPRLFNLVINEAIISALAMSGIQLQTTYNPLKLPMVLAFADDVLVVSQSEEDIQVFITSFEVQLRGFGLKFNSSKSELMVRDPVRTVPPSPDWTIGDYVFRRVTTMRYLGSFMTDSLNRKGNTRDRCNLALRVSKSLVTFFGQYKPPWSLLRSIYDRVINPVMIFGMKAASCTKANRSMLRRYERIILGDLLSVSSDKPVCKKRELLDKKTVTYRMRTARIRYYGHVQRREVGSLLHGAMNYTKGYKKVGRPCFNWLDSLQQDLRRYDAGIDWEQLLMDRDDLAKVLQDAVPADETDSEDELSTIVLGVEDGGEAGGSGTLPIN